MTSSNRLSGRFVRIRALVRKEALQVLRDPSSIAIGVIMPLVLIFLFGFALSLDVKRAPVAIVVDAPSPTTANFVASFALSPYFDARVTHSMREAQELMLERKVDGVVRLPQDFARRLAAGDASVQFILYGADANRARIILGYGQGAVGAWGARMANAGAPIVAGPVSVDARTWFNEANDSHYFLVPGLIVLVMTLIGSFLTTMVMAREWERGTLEALFVTPVRTSEILLGKTLPYFMLGLVGLTLCFLGAEFLFHVPFRGSLLVLAGSSVLYLVIALGIGLLISSAVKNQLVASQLTMVATYLPAIMLSGFIFDLRSMPAPVRVITYVFPARYFVSLLQTVFLAGDVWSIIIPNASVMLAMIAILLGLSFAATRKSLQ